MRYPPAVEGSPSSPATLVSVPGALIEVTHHASVALGGEPKAIVLREPEVAANTLSRIEIFQDGGERKSVLLLWERQSDARGIALLFNRTTKTLFVGAETFAAAVDLQSGRVIDAHTVILFWSFREAGSFVIELGEVDCFLRGGTGEILGEAPVDPPYEIFETPEGVRFESPTMGTQWLHFPSDMTEKHAGR